MMSLYLFFYIVLYSNIPYKNLFKQKIIIYIIVLILIISIDKIILILINLLKSYLYINSNSTQIEDLKHQVLNIFLIEILYHM